MNPALKVIALDIDGLRKEFGSVDEARGFVAGLAGLVLRSGEGLRRARIEFRDASLRLGAALLQLRDQVGHGDWGPLVDSLGMNQRTVRSCMKVADGVTTRDGRLDEEAAERRRAERLAKIGDPELRAACAAHRIFVVPIGQLTLREIEQAIGHRPLPNELRVRHRGAPLASAIGPRPDESRLRHHGADLRLAGCSTGNMGGGVGGVDDIWDAIDGAGGEPGSMSDDELDAILDSGDGAGDGPNVEDLDGEAEEDGDGMLGPVAGSVGLVAGRDAGVDGGGDRGGVAGPDRDVVRDSCVSTLPAVTPHAGARSAGVLRPAPAVGNGGGGLSRGASGAQLSMLEMFEAAERARALAVELVDGLRSGLVVVDGPELVEIVRRLEVMVHGKAVGVVVGKAVTA